jgi:hypothetical protein
MTGRPASAHDEAGSGGTSRRDLASAAQSVGWMIWQGPGRGYIAFDGDLPMIADALEVLWYLRDQQRGIAAVPGMMRAKVAPRRSRPGHPIAGRCSPGPPA